MKLSVPDYILSLKPYSTGKPMEELEREYGIKNSIKLASNENPLGPSPLAIKALKGALKRLNRYPDGGGHNLLKKLSDKLFVEPSNIILGNGSDEIIGMLTRALLCQGDEVIIPRPSFLMYEIMVCSAGAVPVFVPLKSLGIDLNAIQRRITPKTRIIFICNPNNPTGTIILNDDFKAFMEKIPDNILVVVDEAYMEFVKDPKYANSIEQIKMGKPVVTLRTFSKAYGLAGLRIGYGIMPTEISELLNRIRQPFNANLLAQIAAQAALDDEVFLKKTSRLVDDGLEYLHGALTEMGIEYFPTQANFFLINVEKNANEVFETLLRMGVITRSMSSYGYPQYIRINVGTENENRRFINAIGKILGKTYYKKSLLITIDGPAGAGKTTVGKKLASSMNYKYIDTGALYRGVAYNAMTARIDHNDDNGLYNLCSTLVLEFQYKGEEIRLFSNNRDITDLIRTPKVTMFASKVSARPVIRKFLLGIQRDMAKDKGVVLEGRDMGSVVFPGADVKFYLDASIKTRAARRYKEIKPDSNQSPGEVEKEIRIRDTNDSSREIAPLTVPEDALVIDSTDLSIDKVVDLMLSYIQVA